MHLRRDMHFENCFEPFTSLKVNKGLDSHREQMFLRNNLIRVFHDKIRFTCTQISYWVSELSSCDENSFMW